MSGQSGEEAEGALGKGCREKSNPGICLQMVFLKRQRDGIASARIKSGGFQHQRETSNLKCESLICCLLLFFDSVNDFKNSSDFILRGLIEAPVPFCR